MELKQSDTINKYDKEQITRGDKTFSGISVTFL